MPLIRNSWLKPICPLTKTVNEPLKIPLKRIVWTFSVTLILFVPSQMLMLPKKAMTPLTAGFIDLNGSWKVWVSSERLPSRLP